MDDQVSIIARFMDREVEYWAENPDPDTTTESWRRGRLVEARKLRAYVRGVVGLDCDGCDPAESIAHQWGQADAYPLTTEDPAGKLVELEPRSAGAVSAPRASELVMAQLAQAHPFTPGDNRTYCAICGRPRRVTSHANPAYPGA